VIWKKTTFEAPPPGAGLETVIEVVLALAKSDDRMAAVNCVLLTNVVTRGLPFQFTVDPATNPAPFTVRANPAPPGLMLVGRSGRSMKGAAFAPEPATP
jgi:hypothetical protein